MQLVQKASGKNSIHPGAEKALINVLVSLGLGVKNANSTSKFTQATFIRRGRPEVIYISRSAGLTKGCIQIFVRPDIAQEKDTMISQLEGVSVHFNSRDKGRKVFNSNFKGYPVIEGDDKRAEPAGCAYMVDVSNDFSAVNTIIDMLIS